MFKKIKQAAIFLVAVITINTVPVSVFAASGDMYTVSFTDTGLSGEFSQGTAAGYGGNSYGSAVDDNGNMYVVLSGLVSGSVPEGQYYLGAPNNIPYQGLTNDESDFLKGYKGYRFRVKRHNESDSEQDSFYYDYYAFRGWKVSSTGSGQTHNGEIVKPGEQIMITADTQLNAEWGVDDNRNGVADLDEGDFEVLYTQGDGEELTYQMEADSLPPSYKVTAEIATPIQPYYEVSAYNDPEDTSFNRGISEVGALYLPTIDHSWAESNNIHKVFDGWEYDLTSPGQNEATITEASKVETDSMAFQTLVEDLSNNYYFVKIYSENSDKINEVLESGSDEEYEALIAEFEEEARNAAYVEASEWFAEKTVLYKLEPGTRGKIDVRVWDDLHKHYKYLLPNFTANTNVVLKAVWADDKNDNDVPDEEESKYKIIYETDDAGYNGTLPVDSKEYLPGDKVILAQPGGNVDGKIFMGWTDAYWNDQYKLVENPDMEYHGYKGKYPNMFRLYVSSNDFSWAEDFENRYSYLKNENIYQVKGEFVVGDGTVPHDYEESTKGMTFPFYDENGFINGFTYLKNTTETGDKTGEVRLKAWWADDINNNQIQKCSKRKL